MKINIKTNGIKKLLHLGSAEGGKERLNNIISLFRCLIQYFKYFKSIHIFYICIHTVITCIKIILIVKITFMFVL